MLLPLCSARPAARGCLALCCLSLSALGLSGCAQSPSRSLARMWDQMPTVRWSPKEGHADDDTLDSSVAAKPRSKSAKSQDTAGEAHVKDRPSLAKKRMKGADSLARKESSSPKDPFLEEDVATARVANKQGSATNDVDAVTISRRDQLKAELAVDSRRTAPEEIQSAEQARIRLRVESTMQRARLHLANAELAEAQRAAELAQRLSENSGLEFAPDEERPIDLLTDVLARREAERERAALADSDEESEAVDPDGRQETQENVQPTTAEAAVPDPAFALGDDEEFDPYARRAAGEQVAAEGNRIFNTALVVLESPSFEEEVDPVHPTDESRSAEGDRRILNLPFVRKSSSRETAIEDIPEPPSEEETAIEEISLFLPAEEEDSAPLPPTMADEGPRLEPAIQDELPADLEQLDGAVEEIQSAGALPRWLPLTLLSLMTAGLCVWLWRHRSLLNS